MKVLLVGINSKYIHTALGLRYVKEYAKQKGFQIELLETAVQTPILTLLAEVTAKKPDVVGLSVHIWNRNYVKEFASLLKKVLPKLRLVLGGPEVAYTSETVLREWSAVDYIVQGEGEEVFAELLQSFERNTDVPAYVAYRDAAEHIIANEGVAVLQDLNQLPFPYPDLLAVIKEHKIIYYEASRGCPFSCSYCLSGISHKVRRRDLEKVVEDLAVFMRAEAPLVKFVDRTYNLDENYYLPMMEYLAKANTNTLFHFEIKADLLSDKAIQFFKTIPKGKFQFEIGIQSTNRPTLSAIGRHNDFALLRRNIMLLLQAQNIHIHVDLIAGLPYEGLPEFAKSFNDVYELGADMVQLGFLKVLPGAAINATVKEHKMLSMDEPPYEILQTKYLSYADLRLLKVFEDAFEQTYNSGNFVNTMQYLVKIFDGSAFELYKELALYWEKEGQFGIGHNAKGITEFIWRFVREKFADKSETIREILRFDVFVNQTGWQPDWLNWQKAQINDAIVEFWRDKERVNKYLPDYEFLTWREIQKRHPIERFSYNIDKQISESSFYMVINENCGKKLVMIDPKDIRIGE